MALIFLITAKHPDDLEKHNMRVIWESETKYELNENFIHFVNKLTEPYPKHRFKNAEDALVGMNFSTPPPALIPPPVSTMFKIERVDSSALYVRNWGLSFSFRAITPMQRFLYVLSFLLFLFASPILLPILLPFVIWHLHKKMTRTRFEFSENKDQIVVVKQMRISHMDAWDAYDAFKKESAFLSTLDHPLIPNFVDNFTIIEEDGSQSILAIQSFLPGQNLEQHVQTGLLFNEENLHMIASEILNILRYLHFQSPTFLHRDIKPSNILFDEENDQVYLIDFGDASAIEAMVVNGERGINAPNASYKFNTQIFFSGNRTFKWSGNHANIETTLVLKGGQYVFNTTKMRMEVCDLNIDGKNVVGRWWKVTESDLYVNNMEIKNLRGAIKTRGIAIHIVLDSRFGKDFKIYNSRLHNIGSPPDGGAAAASQSISRAVWVSYENTENPVNIHFDRCEIYNVTGTAANGVHFFEKDNRFDHDVEVLIENSKFWGNTRRDIKAHQSNVKVRNCEFTKLAPEKAKSATVSVGFGVTGDTQTKDMWVVGAEVSDCTFSAPEGSKSAFLGITSARGAIVKNNQFSFAKPSVNNAVLIDNRQDGNLIENNIFTNAGIMLGKMGDQGTTTVRNNTFNYKIVDGTQAAVIRNSLSAGINRNLLFTKNKITLDFIRGAGNFYGRFGAHLTTMKNINIQLIDNKITYTEPGKENQVLINFDGTNTIKDNLVTGITTKGAFKIKGNAGFVNTNNRDENGNILTVKK